MSGHEAATLEAYEDAEVPADDGAAVLVLDVSHAGRRPCRCGRAMREHDVAQLVECYARLLESRKEASACR